MPATKKETPSPASLTPEAVALNMKYYNYAREVPKEAQKPFNNGKFSGTDINPMWRIRMLTEMFGACGTGWYFEVLSERSEEHGDTTMAIVDLNLYVRDPETREWSKPIYGTGGNTLRKTIRSGVTTSDEGYKMALTDALSVACKHLGIGANIYFASDRTKYDAVQEPVSPKPQAAPPSPEKPEKPEKQTVFVPSRNTTEISADELRKYASASYKKDKRVAETIKKLNNGSANVATIEDANLRITIFRAIWELMNSNDTQEGK